MDVMNPFEFLSRYIIRKGRRRTVRVGGPAKTRRIASSLKQRDARMQSFNLKLFWMFSDLFCGARRPRARARALTRTNLTPRTPAMVPGGIPETAKSGHGIP